MLNTSPSQLPEKPASSIPQMERGTYPARITSLVDLGNQDGKFGVKRQLWIEFTFPTETFTSEDGETSFTRTKGKFYNVPPAYNEDSHLILLHEAMGCTSDDTYAVMLGKACTVELKPNGDYMNVESVGAPMRGTDVAEVADTVLITEDDWDDASKLATIPEFVKKKIEGRVQ